MKVTIKRIADPQAEQVIIECVKENPDIKDIEAYVLSKGTLLSGMEDERFYSFRLSEVFYFEAVGERVFAYTKQRIFEVKARLYVLEDAYRDKFFVRGSKSTLLNLMLLDSISPALNGRFTAHMKNGEKIMISRQYAGTLKKAVLGGK
ncbi:LytTR family DNA-binding domain-containing protein [Saccharibacillus sp. CPCC 101409]|uniref:LytTR family DNA-binding domain-containing protein n=1 Tax=Saccharibacillus sp. CPCC 101409 TaxID=3058041 RepID=UPI0026729A85|nr:LytTR family DNA-binding domain-containing protein [Saccharibacillus sp. CPCC 101409]MDO3409284.1 LytTR family DNA-binding domain-containing protein [Saccharibacillus sp. CPCC 101409]